MRLVSTRAAAVLLFLGSTTISIGGHAQQDPKIAEAKKHMEAGAALYNDPAGHKCEEAYREFAKAYELSDSLNALKAMGVCALELERDGEAIAHFEQYLKRKGAGIDAADRAQVESDLKALRASAAWVTLKANRADVAIVDVRTPAKGYPITNRWVAGTTPTKVGIHAGSHVFTARDRAGAELSWTVELAGGESYEHVFEFGGDAPSVAKATVPQASPTPSAAVDTGESVERPVPTTVFVFGGLTLAFAVPSAILMARAASKNSEFNEKNGKVAQEAAQELRDHVTTANVVADVFLGVTAASAIATGVFYFTRPAVSQPAVSVHPAFRRGGGGLLVAGAF